MRPRLPHPFMFCSAVLCFCAISAFSHAAAAQQPTQGRFAVSIERFMGLDVTNVEDGDSDATLRLFYNEAERVPTNVARGGFDYFLSQVSIGSALGFTSEDQILLAPRIGYLFPISSSFSFWLRGGFFFYNYDEVDGFGMYADGFFMWSVADQLALHFGPSFDLKLAGDGRDYFTLGLPHVGITAWF